MKNLLSIILSIISISSINGQHSTAHILDSLPTNFSYQVATKSLLKPNTQRNNNIFSSNEMTIGCYQSVKVKAIFSIAIGHPFLFSGSEKYRNAIHEKKIADFKLILHGVRKETNQQDSLLVNALSEYCIYGQTNYMFETNDYILFTYLTAINGESVIRHLSKINIWQIIESQLVKNLNSGASYQNKIQHIQPVSNSFHTKEMVQGKFLWQTTTKGESILSKKANNHLPHSPHSLLHLKKNGTGLLINNYNQSPANRYKYKSNWFLDNRFIYIYDKSFGLKVYEMIDKNTLKHLGGKYVFKRSKE